MKTKIYHNPRCSKSRQTMQILTDKHIDPEVIEYLKTPPDKETLVQLLSALDMKPRELMRTKEKEYLELGLDNPELSDDALIDAMVQHPKLIERPIVVTDKGVAVGRPPENILKIL